MVSRLKSFSIFEGMGIRELHAIASVTKMEKFNPGDVMIRENEENSSIYLLVRGKVGIYSGYGSPDERLKATIGAGSFLGELSLFTRLPPNATCVAAEEADAYVLQHHQFVEIMKVYPQIGINLALKAVLTACRALSIPFGGPSIPRAPSRWPHPPRTCRIS